MKGLISNQNGPKLEEILRLLAQNDEPTHIALRGFGHNNTATVTLKDGKILNADSGSAKAKEALLVLLANDSWHFETFPEQRVTRVDFMGDTEVALQIVGLRAEMQANRAAAETDARRSHRFTVTAGRVEGTMAAAEVTRQEEEFTLLSYYAREIGVSLNLGTSKTLALSDSDRSVAMRIRGDHWEGVYANRLVSVSQILSETN